ncbi:hypothetical protein E4U53_002896 [Claviceps sorghi]|nr:hypothetical protein E4U53_002896 [Claviceps sorghi]
MIADKVVTPSADFVPRSDMLATSAGDSRCCPVSFSGLRQGSPYTLLPNIRRSYYSTCRQVKTMSVSDDTNYPCKSANFWHGLAVPLR